MDDPLADLGVVPEHLREITIKIIIIIKIILIFTTIIIIIKIIIIITSNHLRALVGREHGDICHRGATAGLRLGHAVGVHPVSEVGAAVAVLRPQVRLRVLVNIIINIITIIIIIIIVTTLSYWSSTVR